jgi:hypothetical protein
VLLAGVVSATYCSVHAAELDGVTMSDTREMDGTHLRLNGIGLRTYSMFGIRIYIAGLYLEERSDNPDRILRSSERKVLDVRFLRDIDADNARQAWRDGFEHNCLRPACTLNPADVQTFLSAVPPMHKGDESVLSFTPKGVTITLNGQPMGNIADPHFAQMMLATFIGPSPPTPGLKRALLGAPE